MRTGLQLGPADERSDAVGAPCGGAPRLRGTRASARGDSPPPRTCSAGLVGPPAGAERAATLYHLGVALDEVGDVQAAFTAFDEAVRLAASRRSVARVARSHLALRGPVERRSPQLVHAGCREQLEEAITVHELDDEAGLATAWTKLAFLEFMPCRFDRAERAARRALAHARSV